LALATGENFYDSAKHKLQKSGDSVNMTRALLNEPNSIKGTLKLSDLSDFKDEKIEEKNVQNEDLHVQIDILNHDIRNSKPHPILDDIRKKLAETYGVPIAAVQITNLKYGSVEVEFEITHCNPKYFDQKDMDVEKKPARKI